MRVLVSSTDGAGHFGPLVALLDALRRRGDDVLVVVPRELEQAAAATGHPVRIAAGPPDAEVERIWERFGRASRAERAVLINRDLFPGLCTTAMLPAVELACEDWKPDLVLREPCAFAPAIAAERRGLAHAQVAISMAEVEDGALSLAAPELDRHAPEIAQRLRDAPYLTRFAPSSTPHRSVSRGASESPPRARANRCQIGGPATGSHSCTRPSGASRTGSRSVRIGGGARCRRAGGAAADRRGDRGRVMVPEVGAVGAVGSGGSGTTRASRKLRSRTGSGASCARGSSGRSTGTSSRAASPRRRRCRESRRPSARTRSASRRS